MQFDVFDQYPLPWTLCAFSQSVTRSVAQNVSRALSVLLCNKCCRYYPMQVHRSIISIELWMCARIFTGYGISISLSLPPVSEAVSTSSCNVTGTQLTKYNRNQAKGKPKWKTEKSTRYRRFCTWTLAVEPRFSF